MSSKYHALAMPLLAILFLPTFSFAKCDKPTALKATMNGQQVTLTWSGTATQFMIQIENAKNENKVIPEQVAASPFTTTLINGKYTFKVRSTCGKDKSDWTDAIFFTIGTTPTVPTSTTGKDNTSGKAGESKKRDSIKCNEPSMLAAAISNLQATLTWKGTAPVFLIHVESNQSNAKPIPEVQATSPFLITLDSGKYKFKVKALCDSAHTSAWSDTKSFILGRDSSTAGGKHDDEKPDTNKEREHHKDTLKCNEPGMLAVTVSGLQASLTWKGNAPIYLIHVEGKTGGAKPIPEVQVTSPFLITLDSGTYKFKVKALCDSIHNSEWSDAASFTIGSDSSSINQHGEHEKPDTSIEDDDRDEHKDTIKCNVPSMLAASVAGSQVSLTWKSKASLFLLHIESKDLNSKPISDVQATSPFIISLDTGQYTFKVRALCDSIHSSSWSDAKTFLVKGDTATIPIPVPTNNGPVLNSGNHNKGSDPAKFDCGMPTGLTALAQTNTSALLSWVAVQNARLYLLEIESEGGTPSYDKKFSTTSNSLEISNLTADGNYTFKVRAVCSFAKSDYSRALSFTMSQNTFSNTTLESRSVDQIKGMSIFPNPAHDQITLLLTDARDKYGNIQIHDMNGRIVTQINNTPLDHSIPLNIAKLNTGVFTVRIMTGPTQWVKKLIVQ